MTTRIKVPKLGMTMVEATLVAWTVENGAVVTGGDVICTIEADKAELDVQTPVGGKLTRLADVGIVYQVGDFLAEVH
jgi:pyruvate/2-oxoglutarate dehydrogenase complex dihydrolipoamide acyltransferase (E2) component